MLQGQKSPPKMCTLKKHSRVKTISVDTLKLNSLADSMGRPYPFKNSQLKSHALILSLLWNFIALPFYSFSFFEHHELHFTINILSTWICQVFSTRYEFLGKKDLVLNVRILHLVFIVQLIGFFSHTTWQGNICKDIIQWEIHVPVLIQIPGGSIQQDIMPWDTQEIKQKKRRRQLHLYCTGCV